VRGVFPPTWLRHQCSMLQQRGSAALHQVWNAVARAGSRGLRTIKDASRKTLGGMHAMPWRILARRHKAPLLVLGGVLLALFLLMIIIKVPQRQAASWRGQPGIEPKDLSKLENDARTTLIQGLGGLVLLLGLYFTLRNLQLTQDKQITEHYTRAVEQLGSDRLSVRLGAIYALERIARDSERDHWPIMEILTAYIREHAPSPPKDIPPLADDLSPMENSPEGKDQLQPKPMPDIQAILTVLGRRTRMFGKGEEQPLDLSCTNLQKAVLSGAQLQGAVFTDAQLQEANLRGAQLQGAILWAAQLQGANLRGARLQGADLLDAQLQGANLRGAQLQGADLQAAELQEANLSAAQLQGADLRGAQLQKANLTAARLQKADLWHAQLQKADLTNVQLQEANLGDASLEGARNLTVERLAAVKTLYDAQVDPLLLEQIRQQYPQLLKEPQG
jgi:uncharacterized protein YjbI with pentapeptide repeats